MREIYLDHCATTQVDADIANVAVEQMCVNYGNPSSLHSKGLAAQQSVDNARQQVALALGGTPEEIVFTSGGTEANNLALFGAAEALRRRGSTIVATAVEHSSVLEPLARLEQQGYTVKRIAPEPDGTMDAAKLLDAVDDDTILVSCMMVNSETGSVHPVAELVRGVRAKNKQALIHCDAVQGFGKLPFSAARLGVDLLSVSAHKIHAPKGCGALYIRRGVRIVPRSIGGGQERNMRSGTESVPLIAAFGYAAEKQCRSLRGIVEQMMVLHAHFVRRAEAFEGMYINSPAGASPYLCNVSLPGYRSEILLHFLAQRGIFVSSGSACSHGKASHVLQAMGLPKERVDSALRVSFCKYTTTEDVDAFFDALAQAVREVQPVRRTSRTGTTGAQTRAGKGKEAQ